jgi:hypothetical protein
MLGMNHIWMLNSHAGYYKRATAICINTTMGNSASLIVSNSSSDQMNLA